MNRVSSMPPTRASPALAPSPRSAAKYDRAASSLLGTPAGQPGRRAAPRTEIAQHLGHVRLAHHAVRIVVQRAEHTLQLLDLLRRELLHAHSGAATLAAPRAGVLISVT